VRNYFKNLSSYTTSTFAYIKRNTVYYYGSSQHVLVQYAYFASFLTGRGISGAGGRDCWECWIGEGWVLICVELRVTRSNVLIEAMGRH